MSDKILKLASVPAIAAPGQKVIKHDLFEAGDLAREIVEQGKQEAARLAEEAKAQIANDRSVAVEAGKQEGLREWHDAVQKAIAARDTYLKGCEPEVVKLAVRIAEKILGEQLRANPDLVMSVVREAMRGLRRERNISILVHPSQVERVRGRVSELEAQAGDDCRIRVAANSSVDEGGCIIETELGSTDARLETQLRCLEEILLRETPE